VSSNQTSRRVLSHVETVYRPGENHLARLLLDSLGLKVVETHGYILGFIDEATETNPLENMISASEITPEHWEFEQKLAEVINRPELTELSTSCKDALKRQPQNRPHFGMAYTSQAQWESVIERVKRTIKENPELQGRVELANVFKPGDAGSQSDMLQHAFIYTDIIGTSCLSLGIVIELQNYLRRPPPLAS